MTEEQQKMENTAKEYMETIKNPDVKNFIKQLEHRYYDSTIDNDKLLYQCKGLVCYDEVNTNKFIDSTILFIINLKDESIEKRVIVEISDEEGWDEIKSLSEEEIKDAKETLDKNQHNMSIDLWYLLKVNSREKMTQMPLIDKKELVKQRFISTVLNLEHEYERDENLIFTFIDEMNQQIIDFVEESDDETLNELIMMFTEDFETITKGMFTETKTLVYKTIIKKIDEIKEKKKSIIEGLYGKCSSCRRFGELYPVEEDDSYQCGRCILKNE